MAAMLQSRSKVSVRRGVGQDAGPLSALFRQSWELAYRGIIPALHLESMIRRRDADWWRSAIKSGDGLLVLDVADTVAGYVTFGRSRLRGRYQGEIYELYVGPVYQGLGLGEHLFEGARHALDHRKLNGLVVWALAENEGACDFYWRRGGRPMSRSSDRIGGKKLDKIAFGWR
jgi:ribosomal protein S18 acetylase RimI-like enzyme